MPKPKSIHYKHPLLGYHACGMGDRATAQLTDNIEDVTCRRCLETKTGQKRGPKFKDPKNRPRQRYAFRLDPNLAGWYADLENKTEAVNEALWLLRAVREKELGQLD
jgi:hypothetical protein